MATGNIFKFCCILLVLVVLCCEGNSALQHYCGKALEQALDNICLGGYKAKIKKSMDFELDNNALVDYANYNEIEDEQILYPFSNSMFLAKMHRGRGNLLAKTRRRRDGIADECCTKGCTISELVSYCLK